MVTNFPSTAPPVVFLWTAPRTAIQARSCTGKRKGLTCMFKTIRYAALAATLIAGPASLAFAAGGGGGGSGGGASGGAAGGGGAAGSVGGGTGHASTSPSAVGGSSPSTTGSPSGTTGTASGPRGSLSSNFSGQPPSSGSLGGNSTMGAQGSSSRRSYADPVGTNPNR